MEKAGGHFMVAQPVLTTRAQINQVEEKSAPFKWTSVSIQGVIENDYRLEASVYGIDGNHARMTLAASKWPIVNFGDAFIKQAFYLGRFKRIYVDKTNGIPFILPSQITEIHPKADKYISPNTDVDMESTKVKKGQVLLTRSGTIGTVAYASETLNNKSLSDDVIRIEAREYSGYVYAYLKSSIGRLLVETNNYGAVISHIEPEHLNNIPIPNPSPIIKQQINDLIEESFRLRDESNVLMDEAQFLLKEELQLPDIETLQEKAKQFDKKAGVLNYSVSLSKLDNRLDASYYVPIVNTIEQHLQKNAKEITTISDAKISKKVVLPGRSKRIYVQKGNGITLIGGKNIYALDPDDKNYLAPNQYSSTQINQFLLKENMIIVTARGTIGKVALTPKHWEGYYISDNLIKIIPASDSIAGYLYCFLASTYGAVLIKRQTCGAVVDILNPFHLNNVKIPLLNDASVQKEINDKVLEANKKRTDAYKLEQDALTILDEKVIYTKKI
jgi:type I restriction enzyme S subunit